MGRKDRWSRSSSLRLFSIPRHEVVADEMSDKIRRATPGPPSPNKAP